NKLAGLFVGPVTVFGDFTVFGAKSAAIRHADGSYRVLYAMESPQSWLEDFGIGNLKRGNCRVRIRPDVAGLIRTRDDHDLLTPEGACNGLYISRKTGNGFEVREQGGGRSSVKFSYRIVASRKDMAARRAPKRTLPKLPRGPMPNSRRRRRDISRTPKPPR